MSEPRAARYLELLKIAAERHHTTIIDTRVVFEAGLVLAHEDQTAAMVAGEKIDIATYLRLGEELAKLIPPPKPIEVKILFVNPALTCCPVCLDEEFKPPVSGDATCPKCGLVFDPESPAATREKRRAVEQPKLPLALPPAASTSAAPSTPPASAAPVTPPAAPPPPPPPASPPISETMAAWNRHRGYNRSARDGGLIKGAAVPHQDPNLSGAASGRFENWDNDKPSVWTGYQNRQNVVAEPDVHPYKNSDGSPRVAHKPPY